MPTTSLPFDHWLHLRACDRGRISDNHPTPTELEFLFKQDPSVRRFFSMGISYVISSRKKHWELLFSRVPVQHTGLKGRDGISLQSRGVNMFAIEVTKGHVSLENNGRADLFASLPKIKISYVPHYSGLMQTQSLGSSLPWATLHCPTGLEEQGKPVWI